MNSRVFQTRVMCGNDYVIISWREVIVEQSAVRRQEINSEDCIIANFIFFENFGQLLYSLKPAQLKWLASYRSRTFKFEDNSLSCVTVCNAIIVQLSRIMSIVLTDNVECILECFKPV